MKKQSSSNTFETVNSLEHASTSACSQPLFDRDMLLDRLINAFTNLMQEIWLPFGLRSLLVEELLIIKTELESENPDFSDLACRFHSIALTSYSYPELVLKSKTIAIIRALDLEMTPFATLTQTNCNSASNEISNTKQRNHFQIAG